MTNRVSFVFFIQTLVLSITFMVHVADVNFQQVLAFQKKRRWRQHLFNRMSKMNVLELRNI